MHFLLVSTDFVDLSVLNGQRGGKIGGPVVFFRRDKCIVLNENVSN